MLKDHCNAIISMAFFLSSQQMILVSWNGSIKLWDAVIDACLQKIPVNGPPGPILFNNIGSSLYTNIGLI